MFNDTQNLGRRAKGPPPALPPKPAKFRKGKYKARAMPSGTAAASKKPSLLGDKASFKLTPAERAVGSHQRVFHSSGEANRTAKPSFALGEGRGQDLGERFSWVESLAAIGQPPTFRGVEKLYPSRNADAAYSGSKYLIKHDTSSALKPVGYERSEKLNVEQSAWLQNTQRRTEK